MTTTAPAVERCRSCRAPMVWARTATGTAIPLDATETGDLVMVDDSPLALVALHGEASLFSSTIKPVVRSRKGGPRGNGPRSHFATCPHAPEWRTTKKGGL